MRQVGILAAGAMIALENWEERIAKDHDNAKALGYGLSNIPGIFVDLEKVKTNMVHIDVEKGKEMALYVVKELDKKGIKTVALGNRIRMVTHRDVGKEDVERALDAFNEIFGLRRKR